MNKKLYDILGTVNAVVSSVCFDASRLLKRAGMPTAATWTFNRGCDRSTTMMKYWIKSMNVEDCKDVIVLN